MPESDEQSLRSPEEAQALLRVFTLQTPPDFAAQVFDRIQAQQSAPERPAEPPVPLRSSAPASSGFGKASWPSRRKFWGHWRAIAYGLLTMVTLLIGLLWIYGFSFAVPGEAGRIAAPVSPPAAPPPQHVGTPASVVFSGPGGHLLSALSQAPPPLQQQAQGATPVGPILFPPGLPEVQPEQLPTPAKKLLTKRLRHPRSQGKRSDRG